MLVIVSIAGRVPNEMFVLRYWKGRIRSKPKDRRDSSSSRGKRVGFI